MKTTSDHDRDDSTESPNISISEPATRPHSCALCTRRKVKCDKLSPTCSRCSKSGARCIYEEPQPRKRKRRDADELVERLHAYEEILSKHGLLEAANASNSASPLSFRADPATKDSLRDPVTLAQDAKIIAFKGRSRFVDSFLWKLHHSNSEDELWDGVAEQMTLQGGSGPQLPTSAALFGPEERTNAVIFDVPADVSLKLWDIYLERIDPITRITHNPTTEKLIRSFTANPDKHTMSDKCIVFAIHYFALSSTTRAECADMFGELSWEQVVALCRVRLQHILQDANLLSTQDYQVLQAMIMLLQSVRGTYDAQALWVLAGMAFRVAQRLGMHRDGEKLGLSPFETEIKRRIFAAIGPIDGYAAQLCGVGVRLDQNSWDTKEPLNIEDEDMYPGMTNSITPRVGATSMMYWLSRQELVKLYTMTPDWTFLLRPHDKDHLEKLKIIEKAIDDTESALETKLLRYCDILEPTHHLTLVSSRAAIQSQRFRIYLPYAKAGLADATVRAHMSRHALRAIEYVVIMHSDKVLQRFRWHTVIFFIWDTLIWILHEVQKPDTSLSQQHAWNKLGDMFNAHPDLQACRGTFAAAVSRLAVKAWEAVEARKGSPSVPEFVQALRAKSGVSGQNDGGGANANEKRPVTTNQRQRVGREAKEASAAAAQLEQMQFDNTEWDNGILAEHANIDWDFWDELLRDPDLLRPTTV